MSGVSGLVRAGACACALLFAGCVEDDERLEVREGEQAQVFCEAMCQRSSECGGSQAVSTCRSDCVADLTSFGDVRPEAVEVVAECVRDLPCSGFFESGAFDPCWDRAKREIEPTRATRRFCQAWSTRWFECGASYSVEECESDWALDSARYLERMSACIERDCASLDACAQNVQAGGAG